MAEVFEKKPACACWRAGEELPEHPRRSAVAKCSKCGRWWRTYFWGAETGGWRICSQRKAMSLTRRWSVR